MHGSAVYRVFDALAERLLPPRCVLCGRPGQAPGLDLCRPCELELPWLGGGCARCGRPLTASDAVAASCPACRADPPPYDSCVAALRYEFPLTRLVPALKYEGALSNARVLGTLLARAIAGGARHEGVDAIVPLPLHRLRLVERGYNQAHEIARVVARSLRLPLANAALSRVLQTSPQVGLGREARRQNVRGAFVGIPGVLRDARVALLDDVVTTGSTVAVAAKALLEAGVRRVDVWCVARAPE